MTNPSPPTTSQSPLQRENPLQTPIRFIKGVGPNVANILKNLGIETVYDMLMHIPRRYEDRSNLAAINKVTVGETETVTGKILTLGSRTVKKKLTIFHIVVSDRTGVIYATWFNQPYLKKCFKIGQQVVLHGKIDRYRGKLQIVTPDYEVLADDADLSIHMGRIVPIYPLTQDISQRYLRTIAYRTVQRYLRCVRDDLPVAIRTGHDFISLPQAIGYIHFPPDTDYYEKARQRLVFDEFFYLQLALALRHQGLHDDETGIMHHPEGGLAEQFIEQLPFTLTDDQRQVQQEIINDMTSPRQMNRLLHGDVGSGKTVLAVYTLLVSIQSGFQGALMAPTEILAEQHYLNLKTLLAALNIRVEILKGGGRKALKEAAYKRIKAHEVDLVIGTHALIQEDVVFAKLGCVVIDEQHKFGVMQRALLQKKGMRPDVLIMTATPIPRTLAMTVYGDLDVSTIKELPPGRGSITTRWEKESRREEVYAFIKKEIAAGSQAYIVYPLVSESEKLDLKAATTMYEHLKTDVFIDSRVGMVHGKMKADEKEAVMRAFKARELDILVSTIVIEVGIDVANATVMVVEDAHRFGLAQLHQLRGRIGRGKADSYCLLISNGGTPEARARLNAMVATRDGFKIAEEDLRLRGPGEFFGTRQHGLPELKIANLITDSALLSLARKVAFEIIADDPGLEAGDHRALKTVLHEKFSPLGIEWMQVS